LALTQVNHKACLRKGSERGTRVTPVLFPASAWHLHVVVKRLGRDPRYPVQHSVHRILQPLWSLCNSKGHTLEYKNSILRCNPQQFLGGWGYYQIVVACLHIQQGPQCCMLPQINQLPRVLHDIFGLTCHLIEVHKIKTHPKGLSVLPLLHKHNLARELCCRSSPNDSRPL
jgi:hypothetical protein